MGKIFRVVLIICGALLLALILTSLIIKLKTDSYIYRDIDKVPKVQVAVILGASILKNNSLSPILRERVDRAEELYRVGKVTKIFGFKISNVLKEKNRT